MKISPSQQQLLSGCLSKSGIRLFVLPGSPIHNLQIQRTHRRGAPLCSILLNNVANRCVDSPVVHFLRWIRQQSGQVTKNLYSIGSGGSRFCLFPLSFGRRLWKMPFKVSELGFLLLQQTNKADVILGFLKA